MKLFGKRTDGDVPRGTDPLLDESSPPTPSRPSCNKSGDKVGGAGIVSTDDFETEPTSYPDMLRRIRTVITSGPLSYRVLALIGGIAMIVVNSFQIGRHAVTLNINGVLIASYCIFFGVIVVILEGRFACPRQARLAVRYYAKFTEYTWGRGVFYLFLGSLQLTNWDLFSWITGGYMMFVGVFAILAGIFAHRKLKQLRQTVDSERELKAQWEEADMNNNGYLDVKEFAAFAKRNEVDMTGNEVAAAYLAMDRDFDEKISFKEFYAWWAKKPGSHIPGAGVSV